MMHGCYGVHVVGITKLAYSSRDSQPSQLGMKLIGELSHTINRIGYMMAMQVWGAQARGLFMRLDGDQLEIGSLTGILSRGTAYERPYFILDSYACTWAYILNFDTEMLEIYRGNQTKPHSYGRYAGFTPIPTSSEKQPGFIHHNTPSYRRAEFLKTTYYPCALVDEIPVWQLTEFDPRAHLIDENDK